MSKETVRQRLEELKNKENTLTASETLEALNLLLYLQSAVLSELSETSVLLAEIAQSSIVKQPDFSEDKFIKCN